MRTWGIKKSCFTNGISKPLNREKEFNMELVQFIITAKQAGYAAGSPGEAKTFEDGSKGFEISQGKWRYLDRYYGFNPFSGSEYVFDDKNRLIWIMNYYGNMLSASDDTAEIYAFLRQAMSRITPQFPFRGPPEFTSGQLRYINRQEGHLNCFNGRESIYHQDKKVYALFYHGGVVSTGNN